mmetsp:Transcript_54703/g.123096  ORF Transcript_54703/g.123096 Transcript_54703/m.123096 type:complete len:502 (-) Transcript_54703:93-1598(-)
MPIARRNTPPTSQIKEQISVLNSLSAWTDTGESEEKPVKQKRPYREIAPTDENGQPVASDVPTCKERVIEFFDPESDSFNMFLGLVIIANAIVIGLETEFGRKHFIVLEHIFNSVFVIEMVLRMRAAGCSYFKEMWNCFDFTLVVLGTLDLWIIPLAMGGADSSMYQFSVMRLLRILRLMRILRVVRLFRMFHHLALIMQAFYKALQIVLLISLLVFILDYACAIVLTQGVGNQSAEWGDEKEKIEQWFGSIPRSMQSLLMIMTLCNWDEIATALTKHLPAPVVYAGLVFYIMVTSYTMISLITGIISESLITSQQEFKRRKLQSMEEKRKEVAADLREFLYEMHEDEKDDFGCIEAEDLKTSVRGDTELLGRLASTNVVINEKGILSLIDKMSNDGQQRINIDYFVEKLTNLVGVATASSIVDLKYELIRTQQKLNVLAKKLCPNDPVLIPELGKPSEGEDEKKTAPSSGPAPGKRSSLRNNQDGVQKKATADKAMRFAD